ncbi:MAG: 16S rRNA (cytidine(1402)-2'-O)-methyltransferase [Rhodovulum sulfidophilum]|uniref:Ribosomal RNA small subunit methyltransferase I n=1 Tax=Rhodovulum sulfidophilum TaxID=35806 RepID=A0A2W5N0P9_RHOSU|nr:MAG: 16S rRNA (cytidine(1402)-2'-O)-methyltransferase [Rhodovulum sulfidophilum]
MAEANEETGTGDPDGAGPRALAPGLYLVATPIGAARDITLRALDILAGADILAAEDTRRTRHLLDIHGIRRDARGLVPYHDHNGAQQRPRLLAALAEGRSVALVSDAGTPLVADPGYRLAVEAIAAGHKVHAAPGASALLAALAVAGLPTDRFLFAGFAPPKQAARLRFLGELAAVPATLVFYESPRRLAEALAAMAEVFGGDRAAAVCRELTKRFEETRRGTLGDLARAYADEPDPKGEIVVLIGPPVAGEVGEADLDAALDAALARLSVKDAAAEVARALGLPRRVVYARALERAG